MNKEIPLLPVGTVLHGSYRIVRHLAAGGFGITYEVEHMLMHSRMAIKEFFISGYYNRDSATGRISVGVTSNVTEMSRAKKKFIEEATVLNGMSHPNIVHVTDVFEENGTAYYVMDYIDGQSMNRLIESRGCLSEKEALGYIRQVGDALAYIHKRNRLHLDVKPSNIMIGKDGRATLIDFGVSKQYDDSGSPDSSLPSGTTHGYAPPEQEGGLVREMNAATDVYALGATLYKALTGVTPPNSVTRFSGKTTLDVPDSVSPATRQAMLRAMELRQSDRPQSVAAFLDMLDTANSDGEATLNDEQERKQMKDKLEVLENTIRRTEHPCVYGPPLVNPKPSDAPKEPKGGNPKRTWLWVALAALVIAGVVIGLATRPEKEEGEIVEEEKESFSNEVLSFTANGVTFTMLPVEGGTFTMGATAEQGNDAYDSEKPTHSVTLSSFYMGETEVTQALWQAVMGSNPSYFSGSNLPVEQVSWNDCHEFITKLNQLCASQLNGRQFRLPTEAEWEYAARGGKQSKGYKYSGSNTLDNVAWYDDNSGSTTHAVGNKQANELGLYDMSGNVREWCSDRYGSYGSGAQTDPAGPTSGYRRVYRGGSLYGFASSCRLSFRYGNYPDFTFNSIGLRLSLR